MCGAAVSSASNGGPRPNAMGRAASTGDAQSGGRHGSSAHTDLGRQPAAPSAAPSTTRHRESSGIGGMGHDACADQALLQSCKPSVRELAQVTECCHLRGHAAGIRRALHRTRKHRATPTHAAHNLCATDYCAPSCARLGAAAGGYEGACAGWRLWYSTSRHTVALTCVAGAAARPSPLAPRPAAVVRPRVR